MKLFMILVLPVSLVYTLTENDTTKSEAPYASVLAGLVLGAFYSFVECMFTSSYYLIPYAFFPNYGFYLFFEVLLPCLFCAALYVVFIKRRSRTLFSFYLVLAAFYAVYMPVRIIHRNTLFDWYLLFVKPLMYTCMLLGIRRTIPHLYDCNERTQFTEFKQNIFSFSVYAGILSALVLFPPAVDVMHLLALPLWLILIISFVYIAAALAGTTYLWSFIKKR